MTKNKKLIPISHPLLYPQKGPPYPRVESGPPQPVLVEDEEHAAAAEAEIGGAAGHEDAAEEHAAGGPDVDAVAAAAVDVAVRVALYAVGDAGLGKGEEAAVAEKGLAVVVLDVVGVAGVVVS